MLLLCHILRFTDCLWDGVERSNHKRAQFMGDIRDNCLALINNFPSHHKPEVRVNGSPSKEYVLRYFEELLTIFSMIFGSPLKQDKMQLIRSFLKKVTILYQQKICYNNFCLNLSRGQRKLVLVSQTHEQKVLFFMENTRISFIVDELTK